MSPRCRAIIAQRADAFARKYDYDRAIKDYNHAIKLRPEFWIAFDGRGLAHANRLNFELAIKDYDQSIKLQPDNAEAYYHRGLAKFGLCDHRRRGCGHRQSARARSGGRELA